MTNATKEGEEPIQISDDVSVQMVGVSAFTIYMKNSEGRVETVELLEAEFRAIGPLIQAYLESLESEK